MKIQDHLQLLGLPVKDAVTGFKGVVTSVSFDLYGCVQAVIAPAELDEKGIPREGRWFDVSRLQILDPHPVMRQPDFLKGYPGTGLKGAAEKPAF